MCKVLVQTPVLENKQNQDKQQNNNNQEDGSVSKCLLQEHEDLLQISRAQVKALQPRTMGITQCWCVEWGKGRGRNSQQH